MASVPPFQENGWLPAGRHAASWDDVVQVLRDGDGSHRAALTDRLLRWKDALLDQGVTGVVLLDGSYVSAKENPSDFDVMLIAQPEIQALKDMNQPVCMLLDHEYCEKELGFTVFYFSSGSPHLDCAKAIWDFARDGTPKGVLEVPL